ncbi:MAG: uncharacterized protein JWR82_157 [Blastococcus sp.]|nr:uncharacterized protein [Blastococcus sp.]
MHPDSARELKARILEGLPAAPRASSSAAPTGDAPAGDASERDAPWPWVAVGLGPAGAGNARVAVRLQREAHRSLLPDLGRAAAAEVDIRVIGQVRRLSSPDHLRQHVRPLRPGVSVAHPAVSAGTLGGFVRTASGLAILSNNHVLAASNAAELGDAVLQPGPADGGRPADRVAALTAFQRLDAAAPNLVDAAIALLDPGIDADPGDVPGGPLLGSVPASLDIDPDDAVEKIGRTTGHTRGRVTAVEVDAVAVRYDEAVYRFDDQVEIQGQVGGFSAGGDSGSVIWRSRDRAPLALLFAGSGTGGTDGSGVTFANPLSTVLSVLGVEWFPS